MAPLSTEGTRLTFRSAGCYWLALSPRRCGVGMRKGEGWIAAADAWLFSHACFPPPAHARSTGLAAKKEGKCNLLFKSADEKGAVIDMGGQLLAEF